MAKKLTVGLGVVLLVAAIAALLWYLHGVNIPVLQPKGTVGQHEQQLIILAFSLAAIVVIPVFVMLFVFAYKYREGNTKAKYSPKLDGSRAAEAVWWAIPGAIILVLSVVTWISSNQLDPYRALASTTKPLDIQVVSFNWKWLFIYPNQHIATVNTLELPLNTPVTFTITSDTVMNSFWIPQLGGQIYAMPGMSTQLHLMASNKGSYNGSSANISGAGFAGMTFTANAVSSSDFTAWVKTVQSSKKQLTQAAYDQLAKPTQNNPPDYYSAPANGLYNSIIMKYMVPKAPSDGSQQSMPMNMNNMDMQNMSGMQGM